MLTDPYHPTPITRTATGGSRVAEHNLSPEARDVINAGGKEAPLPKGWLTAEDRAKLMAKQAALDGWSDDAVARPASRAQSHNSIATRALRKSRGRALPSPTGPGKTATAVKVATVAKAKSN